MRPSRKVVSFYGLSAVGKKTLMRRLLHPMGGHYRGRFGIPEGVEAFGPSFAPGDHCRDADRIVAAIETSRAPVVLNQWQWDLDGVVDRLLSEHPEWKHYAIVLYRAPEQHAVDIHLYRDEEPTADRLRARWGRMAEVLAEKESRGLAVEVVDASSDNYWTIDWTSLALKEAIAMAPGIADTIGFDIGRSG